MPTGWQWSLWVTQRGEGHQPRSEGHRFPEVPLEGPPVLPGAEAAEPDVVGPTQRPGQWAPRQLPQEVVGGGPIAELPLSCDGALHVKLYAQSGGVGGREEARVYAIVTSGLTSAAGADRTRVTAVDVSDALRPKEVAQAMGFPHHPKLHADHRIALAQLGNAIAYPHDMSWAESPKSPCGSVS